MPGGRFASGSVEWRRRRRCRRAHAAEGIVVLRWWWRRGCGPAATASDWPQPGHFTRFPARLSVWCIFLPQPPQLTEIRMARIPPSSDAVSRSAQFREKPTNRDGEKLGSSRDSRKPARFALTLRKPPDIVAIQTTLDRARSACSAARTTEATTHDPHAFLMAKALRPGVRAAGACRFLHHRPASSLQRTRGSQGNQRSGQGRDLDPRLQLQGPSPHHRGHPGPRPQGRVVSLVSGHQQHRRAATFIPEFELVTHDKPGVYHDQVLPRSRMPSAASRIRRSISTSRTR